MTKISDQKLIKLARMCREGKSVKFIQKTLGIKSVHQFAVVLRRNGAEIPLPKKTKTVRDWSKIVEKINKK